MPFLNYEKRHSVTSILTAVVSAWRLISFAGAHAGASDDVQGISEEGGKAGDAISLVTGYSYPVEAAGPIAAGSWVGPAADGTGRAAAGGSFGRALTAAAAAGEQVVVVVGAGSGAGLPPAVRGVVSADGNVTAAALPNLVGVPNQTVRLSDGDDAGALLIWAIPEGSTSYAWCWHVWPKASYF